MAADALTTLGKRGEFEFTEKKSVFIGYAAPVKSEAEALAFVAEIKAKHSDARHNVSAYTTGSVCHASDDGEPQGTGGVPVLDVIRKSGVDNAAVVVTRYFGGILLGGGGLVRAYSHAASLACDAAHIMNMCLCRRLKIKTDYGMYGKISYILPNYDTITVSSDFGTEVTLEILVLTEKKDALLKNITEITNGSADIDELEELFEDFSSVKNIS